MTPRFKVGDHVRFTTGRHPGRITQVFAGRYDVKFDKEPFYFSGQVSNHTAVGVYEDDLELVPEPLGESIVHESESLIEQERRIR